jgi:rhodanese-related sulfurtransferase
MQFFDENGRIIVFALLAVAMLAPWFLSQMRDRQNLRWVEAEELSTQLESKTKILVLDVRTRGEFTGPLGHIKGAMNIPVNELSSRLKELSSHKEKPIVVVCRTDNRATTGAKILTQAGMSDVTVLRGGMSRWSQLH